MSSVTIRDIAEMAGVSTATVSRVINDSGFVKDETRQIIEKIIDEHKYVPNDPKKRKGPKLRVSTYLKHNNFCLLWRSSEHAPTTITGQILMQGISKAVSSLGATLNIEFVNSRDEIPDILNSMKTDGLFLHGSGFAKGVINKAKQLPSVWLFQAGSHDFGDRVQPDHEHIGHLAFDYLRKKGCKKLCCISCSNYKQIPSYWQTREMAFRMAATVAGMECEFINLDYNDSLENPVEMKASAAREAVRIIKEADVQPDGLFVANTLGLPVFSELMASGIIPMRDIEFIAGDVEVCNGYLNPEPVKIDIQARAIGEFALDALIWRLQNPDKQQVTHLLKPKLVIPKV